ncbi:phosphoribosylglycinamide formyltransferase-1 [Nonomuraea polychroma]|uniref:Phosphoribosylglycinamide formyltransferase n=1 Tax=Nonomuraea polychroma TaxID=46176 RepID=A0A438MN70_9ACTN|nr:phosphoribosylglycinamide formyltransferase [Nonomuraea polychroma]RVX47242.1 phosphoribosylglycinamide formyltransferase-1 [Nonomuraea polychroma]
MSKAGRLVVLVSGSGTNLQALLDASADPSYGARVVAVGADREGIEGLVRATKAGVPTFVEKLGDYPTRADWDRAIAAKIASYEPDLVVSAGFMKILGAPTLDAFPVLNTHPALLPSFPGAHGVRDALAHGVKVTGCTVMLADEGIDTGPIVAQEAVPVLPDDDEETLHERIKTVERRLLVEIVGRMAREGWTASGRHVRIGNQSEGEST